MLSGKTKEEHFTINPWICTF